MMTPPAMQPLHLLGAIIVAASVLMPTRSGPSKAAVADAMRIQLVREHLRFVKGPRAMLEFAEQDLATEGTDTQRTVVTGAQKI